MLNMPTVKGPPLQAPVKHVRSAMVAIRLSMAESYCLTIRNVFVELNDGDRVVPVITPASAIHLAIKERV